ncbi:hypothetical protein JCM10908_003770 [Rhodotorula pacifica]|uniref:uncharacterized protein n=1 Tax=Rhodotorula pacifica TaxID=1495444 RepID=UPI00316FD2FC
MAVPSVSLAANAPPFPILLANAYTLPAPTLLYALYRLSKPLFSRTSHLKDKLSASLALAAAGALSLYAITALVALSAKGSWTVAVASGAFGCLSVALRFGLLFSLGLIAILITVPAAPRGTDIRQAMWDPERGIVAGTETRLSRTRRIQLLAILTSSIILDILSVAFPTRPPYSRFALSGNRLATWSPTLLGPSLSSEAGGFTIALFALLQMVLLIECVRAYASAPSLGVRAPGLPRSIISFDSSFVEITLPQPSLATGPHRSLRRLSADYFDYTASNNGHESTHTTVSLFTTPAKAVPIPKQLADSRPMPNVLVEPPARCTPSPCSHRSLPPLVIGAHSAGPAPSASKGVLHAPPLARPSTAPTRTSLARPSTASTSRSHRTLDERSISSAHGGRASVSSSSPKQYRKGGSFSSRQVRSGSYSSSSRRISGAPSLTRLSTLFNSGGVPPLPTPASTVTSSGPSIATTRRRSSSVGSLLRSVVASGPAPAAAAPAVASPDWEVEPNEAHDDPFARPPPTPSTPTPTPAAIATPTRAESIAAAGGAVAPSRLVRALEAIEEPENGSPPNPASSADGVDVDELATRPSSEGDHLERVMTPLATASAAVEEDRACSARSRSDSAASSIFREHFDDEEYHLPTYATPPPATPTLPTSPVLEYSTPSLDEHDGRPPPNSPTRRRTDRRASSPVRPSASFDFPSRSPGAGNTPSTLAAPSPTLSRNCSSSLRLFAANLASSGSAKLVSLRRIRSSLRRRSPPPSPSPSPRGTDARPSESSELSFSCRGAKASVPELPESVAQAEQATPPRSVSPTHIVALVPPPPASVRLSVGSRKAWWKRRSVASRASSSYESGYDSSDKSTHRHSRLLLVPDCLATDPAASNWLRTAEASTGGRPSAAANARWSGYQLPPLDDISPMHSDLCLPEGLLRSDSRNSHNLRRTESSPAMIGHLPSMPRDMADATFRSFAASSKFSSASFVTAHSTTDTSSAVATFGIELDELNHLVNTFAPLPVEDATGSPPSSAALSPQSPLFDLSKSNCAVDDDDLISPVTPATPSAIGCLVSER